MLNMTAHASMSKNGGSSGDRQAREQHHAIEAGAAISRVT
jgi:hypothetical protein